MTSKSRKLRGAAQLTVICALAALAFAAAPGLANGGPSPEHLAAQGWECFVPPVAGAGVVCFNPAQGRPPRPPLGEDGRASYMAVRWTPAGEFQGHVHLIRPDLYAGQPCPQAGGLYIFNPRIGYYECVRDV